MLNDQERIAIMVISNISIDYYVALAPKQKLKRTNNVCINL